MSMSALSSRPAKMKHGPTLPQTVDNRTRPATTKLSRAKHRKTEQVILDSITDSPTTAATTTAQSVNTNISTATKKLSHVPCKFYKQGACQAGENCPFSHSLEGSQSADKMPCKFFQRGNCKFGSKCALAHILPNGQRVNPPRGNANGSGKLTTRDRRRSHSFAVREENELHSHDFLHHSDLCVPVARLQELFSPKTLEDTTLYSRLGLESGRRGADFAPFTGLELGLAPSGGRLGNGNITPTSPRHLLLPLPRVFLQLQLLLPLSLRLAPQLAPRLAPQLAPPTYMPQYTSILYNNIFGSVSPPAQSGSRQLHRLLVLADYEYFESSAIVDDEGCEHDDCGGEVFEEDYVPESLSDIILTPQEMVRRQSRSQLGTLLSRPTGFQSPRGPTIDINVTAGAPSVGLSPWQEKSISDIAFTSNPENVFVMD